MPPVEVSGRLCSRCAAPSRPWALPIHPGTCWRHHLHRPLSIELARSALPRRLRDSFQQLHWGVQEVWEWKANIPAPCPYELLDATFESYRVSPEVVHTGLLRSASLWWDFALCIGKCDLWAFMFTFGSCSRADPERAENRLLREFRSRGAYLKDTQVWYKFHSISHHRWMILWRIFAAA